MTKSILVVAAAVSLLSGPAALAQTGVWVVPNHVAAKEGNFLCDRFFAAQNGRYQLAEGELLGTATVIGRVGMRRDTTLAFTPAGFVGRSWTRVTCDVSDCNMKALSTTFGKNATSKPVRLFDAKFALPTQTKHPASRPAPFEAALSLAFSKPYSSTGKNGILLDFQFRGGVLANGGTQWGSANYPYAPYFLDDVMAMDKTGQSVAIEEVIPPLVRGAGFCSDTGQQAQVDAYVTAGVTIFGDSYARTTLRGKSWFSVSSLYTARFKPVVFAVAPGGSTKGVAVGAVCNRLHVDLSGPFLLFPASSNIITYAQVRQIVKSDVRLVGLTIWNQAAWTDDKTGRFSLTNASRYTVPTLPGWRIMNRAAIHEPSVGKAMSSKPVGWHKDNPTLIPVTRYSVK